MPSPTRAHARFRCSVATAAGDVFYATTERLGVNTILLSAPRDLPYGSPVTVELPSEEGPVAVPATVRWHTDSGFGLQFGPLHARAVHAIHRLAQSQDAVRS